MTERLVLGSLSGAMDGGLTAIAEVAEILRNADMLEHSRLIGGVTVLLHQQRLGVNLPLRATGDADFGVPPYLLREPALVVAIEARGYKKVAGNRWERPIDAARTAAIDLLIPTYRSRARDTVQVGDVVTTEVPGLAEALRRPGIETTIEIVLDTTVDLGDAARPVRGGVDGTPGPDRRAVSVTRPCHDLGGTPLAAGANRGRRRLRPPHHRAARSPWRRVGRVARGGHPRAPGRDQRIGPPTPPCRS